MRLSLAGLAAALLLVSCTSTASAVRAQVPRTAAAGASPTASAGAQRERAPAEVSAGELPTGRAPDGEVPDGELPAAELPPELEAFLRTRFDEARELYRARNFGAAFKIADAILALAPGISFRGELREFRRNAEGRYLGGSVLTIRFEPDPSEFVLPMSSCPGAFVIENVSDHPVRIGERGSASAIGQVRVSIRSHMADGTERKFSSAEQLRIDPGRDLEPGATLRVPHRAELESQGPSVLVQFITIEGQLLPTVVNAEGRVFGRGIPILETGLVLLPPDCQEVRQSPLRDLQIALLSGDARRAWIAGILVQERYREGQSAGSSERQRTVELLVDQFDSSAGEMQSVVMHLLRGLTGERFAAAVEWRAWLARGKRGSDSER